MWLLDISAGTHFIISRGRIEYTGHIYEMLIYYVVHKLCDVPLYTVQIFGKKMNLSIVWLESRQGSAEVVRVTGAGV